MERDDRGDKVRCFFHSMFTDMHHALEPEEGTRQNLQGKYGVSLPPLGEGDHEEGEKHFVLLATVVFILDHD
jgi:hypothetical protein